MVVPNPDEPMQCLEDLKMNSRSKRSRSRINSRSRKHPSRDGQRQKMRPGVSVPNYSQPG